MSTKHTTAEVRVVKHGPMGRPVAEISVGGDIGAEKLGALIQGVTTNERVLGLAGLRACLGCKSGLDINIIDRYQEIIEIEV